MCPQHKMYFSSYDSKTLIAVGLVGLLLIYETLASSHNLQKNGGGKEISTIVVGRSNNKL